jgi:hypothetical protein
MFFFDASKRYTEVFRNQVHQARIDLEMYRRILTVTLKTRIQTASPVFADIKKLYSL